MWRARHCVLEDMNRMAKEANTHILDKGVMKIGAIVCACFIVLAGLIYWVVAEELQVQRVETDTVSPQMAFSDAGGELLVEQTIVPDMDVIEEIQLWSVKKGYAGVGDIDLQVLDNDTVIYQTRLPAEGLPESGEFSVAFENGGLSGVRGKAITLRLVSPRSEKGLAATFIYGVSVDIGKFDVASNADMDKLTVNGSKMEGHLYCALSGYNRWPVMQLFWPVAVFFIFGLLIYIFMVAYKKAHQKFSVTIYALECYQKYLFLIRQLVSRDFNTKYRRSVLGVIWSFLNPLLTMAVQYIVFSVLFRSEVENFQLYLLSGIVLFNFFNESVSMGMESITGNASLINKVYMPKYIYPISKVLSSAINLLISFVPLLAVMLFSKVSITKAME
jgi:ABC-2 type transport system permease protein